MLFFGAREIAKLSSATIKDEIKADELSSSTEQKSKRKSKWDTTDKEKLDNLYKKVERSAFTGQKPTSQSLIELAKALMAEGHEGNLVNLISRFTTFTERYIQGLLPKEFKQTHEKSELSSQSKQKTKRKPRKQTSDEEKLKNLHNKVVKSVFTGQGSFFQYIESLKLVKRAT